jgi:hypothetical protein
MKIFIVMLLVLAVLFILYFRMTSSMDASAPVPTSLLPQFYTRSDGSNPCPSGYSTDPSDKRTPPLRCKLN